MENVAEKDTSQNIHHILLELSILVVLKILTGHGWLLVLLIRFLGRRANAAYLLCLLELGGKKHTPARRYTARAATNQGSIGTTNRISPVLMIAKSVKKSSWKLPTRSGGE
jgi:hypothetical protein